MVYKFVRFFFHTNSFMYLLCVSVSNGTVYLGGFRSRRNPPPLQKTLCRLRGSPFSGPNSILEPVLYLPRKVFTRKVSLGEFSMFSSIDPGTLPRLITLGHGPMWSGATTEQRTTIECGSE